MMARPFRIREEDGTDQHASAAVSARRRQGAGREAGHALSALYPRSPGAGRHGGV